MGADYRKSHLQPDKGRTYHEAFAKNPYRRMMWDLEKGVLDRILNKFFVGKDIRHLDFACGTGRILAYLSGRASLSVGVDVSPSMLEVARQQNRNAEILEADLTANDVLGDRKFNLITAFRFFPNAQPELRTQVMTLLHHHLEDGGCLVFNNHKNTGSTRNRLARLVGRRGYQGMSWVEVEDLLGRAGLGVVGAYHLATFPSSDSRTILPVPLLRTIESLASRLRPLRKLGENIIFVCRKN